MEEEGIDTTQSLAYADEAFPEDRYRMGSYHRPIDQALLFNYIDGKLADLRPIGIRGSIELAVIYERLKLDGPEAASAAKMISCAASNSE